MTATTPAAALEQEHREIDAAIEAFLAGLDDGALRLEALRDALQELRRHIYVEEVFLFPPLRRAGLLPPVLVMVREHGAIWQTLDELDGRLARDPAGPATRDLLHRLTVQLLHHNMKEERILYPESDRVLGDPERADLDAMLEFGELPDGWVCERAAH
jgi:iron-sulfur cluster repair protein YtfE (RIC family)